MPIVYRDFFAGPQLNRLAVAAGNLDLRFSLDQGRLYYAVAGIGSNVERSSKDFDGDIAGMDQEGIRRIMFNIKIGFAPKRKVTVAIWKSIGVANFAASIQPHLRSIGQVEI